MDEALYNNTLAALDAVHGAHTSNEARQAAGSLLEAFKDRTDCMPYALYILQTPSPRHTDQVRHFALHTLERMLKLRWRPQDDYRKKKNGAGNGAGSAEQLTSVPGEAPPLTQIEKEQLKESLLQVMARGTRDVAVEAQFIKIKVADLVAQLAERDYPQRWEGFIDQMMQAWTMGPTQAELAMIVLARIIEDCHDIDFRSEMDFSRRDSVLRGLNEFLPQLMPTLYNFLVQQWQAFQAAGSTAGAGAGAGAGVTEGLLINRALMLLSKILPWVGEKSIGAENHDFLPAMAQLSNARVARSEALVCLEVMCSQKLSEAHFQRLLENLPNIVTDVKNALAQESVPLSESLEVHQMLSACLEETIIRNISFIVADQDFLVRTSGKSELLSKFLKQVLHLTQMPSKRMAGNLLQAWQALAHKPSVKEIPSFVVLVPQLLAAFASHSVAVRFEDDVTDDVVAAEEFVDEDDYHQFIQPFRTQVKILQLQLAKLNPLHTVQYISEQAQSLLQHHAIATDNLDPRGYPTWNSEAVRSWCTFAALAKGVIVGLPDWCTGDKPSQPDDMMEGGTAGFVSLQCFDTLRSMATAIIKWTPNGSILIGFQLTVLESCRRLFVHESSMLQAVFDKLFALLEAPDPSINLAAMPNVTTVIASPEVETVRQAASRTLVTLATDVSSVLVVALGSLCQRVSNVLNNNRPSLAVRTQLLELLVVVSNSVKDDKQRRAFVLDMLKDPMSVWTGDGVTQAVSSPEAFLARLGITPDLPQDETAYAPKAPLTIQAAAAFQTLRAPLTVLHGLGLRVSVGDDKSFRGDLDAMVRAGMPGLCAVNPIATAWSQALPNIVNMIRCVHLLWSPPTRQQLLGHPVARATLAMIPSQESEQNRRKNKSGDYEVSPQDLQNFSLVAQWCRMLHDLRTVCYNLLGLACRQGALYLAIPADKVQEIVVDRLLAGLDYVENRHLPGLCSRFLEKYLLFCPPCLMRSHVQPVMIAFTHTLMPRLSASWSPDSAGAQTLQQTQPEMFQVYAHGGAMLTQEDLDKEELEEIKVKHRMMLTRGLADFIHTCLGLRGELFVPEPATQAGRNTNNYSNNRGGRSGRGTGRGGRYTAPTPKEDKVAESKKIRRRMLVDVLVRGETSIPPSILMFTVGLIRHWGDSQACRKALNIATAIMAEYDLRSDVMRQKLSRDLFRTTIDALVEGAAHLRGMEWEAVVLVKNLYVAFGLSGTGATRPGEAGRNRRPDDSLRQKLLSLTGVLNLDVATLDETLRDDGLDPRAQKEAMRDVLRRATMVAMTTQKNNDSSGGPSSGFWQDNRGKGGGGKSQGSSRNRHKGNYNNYKRGDGGKADVDPSSDVLWQQQNRRR